MRIAKMAKIVLATTLSLVLATSFIGCTKKEVDKRVAATVNGVEIYERDVIALIESFRLDQFTGETLDDVAWATMLQQNGLTPETLRDNVIRYEFAFYILLLQKAEAMGITPNTEEIDATIATAKASIESSGMTFESYLVSLGLFNEDAYRRVLEANDIKDAVSEKMIDKTPPAQDKIDAYISENASYFLGKRASLIVFNTDNEDPELSADVVRAQAEEARQEILSGATFESVAEKYMADTAPELAAAGGDLGWGTEAYLPQEVRDALSLLELEELSAVIETFEEQELEEFEDGAVSEEDEEEAAEGEDGEGEYAEEEGAGAAPLTERQYTFFLAKYTDNFVLADEDSTTSIDVSKVPEDIVTTLTEEYVAEYMSGLQNQFFIDLALSDEIIINPMPDGLSYAVDMSLAEDPHGHKDDYSYMDFNSFAHPFDTGAIPSVPSLGANGLGIDDLIEGTGQEVHKGDTVEVNYIGYLEGELIFDASYSRGQAYPVTVGSGEVIEGWDLGLVGMKVGGQRFLTIPPELAYGSSATNGIPSNSTLYFLIELVSVNGDSTAHPASED